MNDERAAGDDKNNHPVLGRRTVGVGLLAVLAGGFGVVKTAQAFPPAATGLFNAASSLLRRFGLTVRGHTSRGHDVLDIEIAQLPATEYRQTVGIRGSMGEILPCVKTSVFDDDARFIHFHPGEIVPCVKTTVEEHALATHELFDADQGGIDPCFRVSSEMLDGGHIGTIEATHFHPTDGEIIPCVKTTIEGHSLATHELFDAPHFHETDGEIIPCLKIESQMLEGGLLGAVGVTINDPGLSFSLRVDGNTYYLVNGKLLQLGR